jgi:diadenosine tetraphosphate (Ap4A) HIT family hydrolase
VVATRKHAESFAELSMDEMGVLMKTLGQALVAAEKSLAAERYYVLRVNDKLPHLHFHLIPRLPSDHSLGSFIFGEGGWSKTLAQSQSTKDIELFVSKFKRSFESRLADL